MTHLLGVARRVSRAPVIHFFVIGGLLFALDGIANSVRAPAKSVIEITRHDIAQLEAAWVAQNLRAPDSNELRLIIDRRIDEEALSRKARELGLDQGDAIIRRRLAQKMAFIADAAASTEPSEPELRAFFDARKMGFATPARISFDHVYFGASDESGSEKLAVEALDMLRSGAGGDHATMGIAFPLPRRFSHYTQGEIARDFGAEFAEAVFAGATNKWRGPFRSAFGLHVVRVTDHAPAVAPSYESVKQSVLAVYSAEAEEKAARDFVQSLRDEFVILIDDDRYGDKN